MTDTSISKEPSAADCVSTNQHKKISPLRTSTTASTSNTSHSRTILAPLNKQTCDAPAYLFWKMQSQLVKLSHRLRLERLKHK